MLTVTRGDAETAHLFDQRRLLGTMGKPKKVEVKGQTVWIGCEGCRDKVENNPEKYLDKIAKSDASSQG